MNEVKIEQCMESKSFVQHWKETVAVWEAVTSRSYGKHFIFMRVKTDRDR